MMRLPLLCAAAAISFGSHPASASPAAGASPPTGDGAAGSSVPAAPTTRVWSTTAARRVGTVTGRVTEAVSGRPLANVQVSTVGTRLGALTNAEGRFTIAGVPDGAQAMRTLLIGYAPLTRRR